MLTVIFLFVLGFAVGLLLKRWVANGKLLERLITIAIWLMLFVLGISVGSNRSITANLHTLGLWSLLIAVGATIGSIACVAVIDKFIFNKREK